MINHLIEDIVYFLKSSGFFSNLPDEHLRKLANQFELIYVHGGEIVIHQGDPGDCLYLVLSGRLRTIKTEKSETQVLSESGRGELIGELALITQEPRSATVVAIRDSILLKLSKTVFNNYINEHPLEMLPIAKYAILRILHPNKLSTQKTGIITLAPAGRKCPLFSKFTAEFVKQLSSGATTLHLTRESTLNYLKQENIQTDHEHFNSSKVINWLNDQEAKYSYIVYETDAESSDWTQLCIRQADQIVLVAMSNQNESLGKIENDIYSQPQEIIKAIHLVLLHESHILIPTQTAKWLNIRKVTEHHHVKEGDIDTLKRLVRCVTGRAIAFVFSGSGARGLSYIGVYKAIRELNIPIDYIGATSSGSLVSCLFAYDYSPDQVIEIFHKELPNMSIDYTLPIVSLSAGSLWAAGLKGVCGDTNIEDLWKNFFCIATNITQHRMNILQTGLVWKAVRSSVSLPGIVPPVSNDKDELLIDGAIVNNFPVDIMRSRLSGGRIIGANIHFGAEARASIPDGILSGWKLFFNQFSKDYGKDVPRIAEIILSSIILSSLRHQEEMTALTDCCIDLDLSGFKLLDFKAIDQLIELGYIAAMEKLSDFEI